MRAIAYDLNRCDYDFLPNSLVDILHKYNGNSLLYLEKALIAIANKTIAKEYIDFLIKKEYIFIIEREYINQFSCLNLEFNLPSHIFTAIIDIEDTSMVANYKIIEQLNDLGCKHLLFRFSNQFDIERINVFLSKYKTLGFHSIGIWMYSLPLLNTKNIKAFCMQNVKINKISIFNHKINKQNNFKTVEIQFYKANWTDATICLANRNNFHINITLFLESLTYNPYFNKKIYIDKKGFISNAPYCMIFGNIKTTNIASILNEDFKFLWAASKDKTFICKDCEYRYMCVDNRIPKKSNNGMFFFENGCNYNPYIARWKDQEGYVPVEECGTYDREAGFVPGKTKIAELNKRIWCEGDN
jgi:SPASM domain peptide maturase of grasp-with-spasm system